jgi:6,7-dimethyl-8-ribityllumazine synthase
VTERTEEPQDWPLRDWSVELRPPAQPAAEPEILYEAEPESGGEPGAAAAGAEPAPAEPSAAESALEESAVEEPVEEPAVEEAAVRPEQREPEPAAPAPAAEHAEGGLRVPEGYAVLEGSPNGSRRSVAVVVSRFNGEITNRLLESALAELEQAGVAQEAILVMPVPGAFELPIAAMALAKTRRYACVVALGCVIRGETPHFDFVATEAASGLQLAGIETGVPVSFGVLTCDTVEQAEARVGRGAWAARSALEMADAFAQLRTAAAAARQ